MRDHRARQKAGGSERQPRAVPLDKATRRAHPRAPPDRRRPLYEKKNEKKMNFFFQKKVVPAIFAAIAAILVCTHTPRAR